MAGAGTPPYRYWPAPGRPDLEWPDGKRLAVYVGVNIEHWLPGVPALSIIPATAALPVDPGNFGWRDYGNRAGIWRMIELFDELELPLSVPVNSDCCSAYPEVIAAGKERGWAWVGHGRHSSEVWAGMEPEAEREALAEVLATIEAATGSRPRGWLGPALTETAATPELFAELGGTYLLDWCCDDQPFPLEVEPGPMLSVPYSIELNDVSAFADRGQTGEDFAAELLEQFHALLAESRRGRGIVMSVGLHPYISGQPHRHRHLAEALRTIAACEEAWITTSDEIAAWYLEHHLDAAVAAIAARPEGR